jgi:hypothetical protein
MYRQRLERQAFGLVGLAGLAGLAGLVGLAVDDDPTNNNTYEMNKSYCMSVVGERLFLILVLLYRSLSANLKEVSFRLFRENAA